MKSRIGFFTLGTLLGLLLGASVTAHAATDLERTADRIARALERIAAVLDHGHGP